MVHGMTRSDDNQPYDWGKDPDWDRHVSPCGAATAVAVLTGAAVGAAAVFIAWVWYRAAYAGALP